MATVTAEVDVELDEFDTIEIIQELRDRIKYKSTRRGKGFNEPEKKALIELVAFLNRGMEIGGISLLDQMKIEAFLEAKDNFSLTELQEALKK